MALGEGDVLGGYRVVRLLGRGGMGAVYLADDVRLGRKVALKVLTAEAAGQPSFRERFVRESQMAASLDHPNILPIYEAGEEGGEPFIAMRYVPGLDLDGLIRRDRPLSLERTTAIIDQVASALDAAHASGLIHRDVKPGNILVATGSQPGTDHAYLSDFGLTKRAEYTAQLTRSGHFMGSVGYVAPEQIENRPIDARVDVYSLGCVLFECLTGAQPYPRDSEMATLYAHIHAPPPSLAEARPELPPTIDAVIAKALAKVPDERYATAGELARGLVAAASPDAAERHLTRGFLFADLRGYTEFVEAQGDAAAAGLLEVYRRLVRDVVGRFGGAEIKTEGDSFYIVFASASDAVRCGLAISAASASATAEHPERPIRVGVGIHAGESTETAEGYVGSAVNIAARVCAQAAAGEVLVTDTVRGLTRTSGEVSFTARGRKHLKGIAEPVLVYAASAASGPAAAGGPSGNRSRLTQAILVAGAGLVGLVIVGSMMLTGAGAPRPTTEPPPSGKAPTVTATVREVNPSFPNAIMLDAGVPVTAHSFQPRIEFTPPDGGWYALDDRPDVLALVAGSEGSDLLHAEEDVTIATVQVVLEGPCEYSNTRLLERTPDALIRHLQSNPYVAVSAPEPRNIAGYAGVSVQITVKKQPVDICSYADFPPKNRAVFLFPLGSSDTLFSLRPESALRVTTLDVQGRSVTFVAEWNKTNPSFEARADSLLESVRFRP